MSQWSLMLQYIYNIYIYIYIIYIYTYMIIYQCYGLLSMPYPEYIYQRLDKAI